MNWRNLLDLDLRQWMPGWRPFPAPVGAVAVATFEAYPRSVRKKIADPMWRGPALASPADLLFVLEQIRLCSRCGIPVHLGLEAAARNEFETPRACGTGNKMLRVTGLMFAILICGILFLAVHRATSGIGEGISLAFMAGGSSVVWIAEYSQGRARRAAVCGSLIQSMGLGLTLSESMSRLDRFFPKAVVAMVAAGEATNRLAETVEQLNCEALQRLIGAQRLSGWLVYVGAVIVGNVAVIGFLIYKVVPVLLEITAEIRPPDHSANSAIPDHGGPLLPPLPSLESLGTAPGWMQVNLILIGLTVAVFMFLAGSKRIARSLRWSRFPGQGLDLHIPVYRRIVALQNVGSAAGMLGQLLRAGVTLDRALQTVSESDPHPAYAAWFRQIGERVRGGDSLSNACAVPPVAAHIPPSFLDAIATGERLGRLVDSLDQVSDRYIVDATIRAQWWVEVTQVGVILIMGYVVLSMEVGVFAMLVELADNLMR